MPSSGLSFTQLFGILCTRPVPGEQCPTLCLTSDAGARGFATVKLMFTLAEPWPLFVVPSHLLVNHLSLQYQK